MDFCWGSVLSSHLEVINALIHDKNQTLADFTLQHLLHIFYLSLKQWLKTIAFTFWAVNLCHYCLLWNVSTIVSYLHCKIKIIQHWVYYHFKLKRFKDFMRTSSKCTASYVHNAKIEVKKQINRKIKST